MIVSRNTRGNVLGILRALRVRGHGRMVAAAALGVLLAGGGMAFAAAGGASELDALLAATLRHAGFTGGIQASLPARLGRPVDPRLAQAALDAVKQWVYEPALLNGEPVETATTITLDFRLEQ